VEFKLSQLWLNRFAEVVAPLCDDWLPADKARGAMEKIKIPYVPFFSFGENLPVLTHGTTDPDGMGFAFATATNMLVGILEDVAWHGPSASSDAISELPPRAGKGESVEEQ